MVELVSLIVCGRSQVHTSRYQSYFYVYWSSSHCTWVVSNYPRHKLNISCCCLFTFKFSTREPVGAVEQLYQLNFACTSPPLRLKNSIWHSDVLIFTKNIQVRLLLGYVAVPSAFCIIDVLKAALRESNLVFNCCVCLSDIWSFSVWRFFESPIRIHKYLNKSIRVP